MFWSKNKKNLVNFNMYAQNIDCEAILTSTHKLCFGAKIRKKIYPCIPQFYYIKVGLKGVFIARTCFPDVMLIVKYIAHIAPLPLTLPIRALKPHLRSDPAKKKSSYIKPSIHSYCSLVCYWASGFRRLDLGF